MTFLYYFSKDGIHDLRKALADYPRYDLLMLMIAASVILSVASLIVNLLTQGSLLDWLGGWLQNFSTELVGAIITFGVFEVIFGDRQLQIERARIRSKLKETSDSHELQELFDQMIALEIMHHNDFRNSDFHNAVWRHTTLRYSDLQNANLQNAVLEDVSLREVNLVGVNFEGVTFISVKLPDSTMWTPDTDMARFTNPEHPDFWRSDRPQSPAYRGRSS